MRAKKTILRLAVFIMCFGFLASLLGCGSKNKHILDGPGMVNPASWDKIIVSRSCDSFAQNNFYIEVTNTNEGYVVTGSLIGEKGSYEEEEGKILSARQVKMLYDLSPDDLPDVVYTETTDSFADDVILEDVMVLDQPSVDVKIYFTDGRQLKKVDEDNFSLKVYEIVLPCFEK